MIDALYLGQKIEESGKSKTFLADKLGITRSAFYSKIKGKTEFSGEEFMTLIAELGYSDIPEGVQRFFLPKGSFTSERKE